MQATFDFSQTDPAGGGITLPEGVYRATVFMAEDQPPKDGDSTPRCRVTFKVDPSEGHAASVRKTYRYPNGQPDDGALAFWMSLIRDTGIATVEQMKAGPVPFDPVTNLPTRAVCIRFIPRDESKNRNFYDVQTITQQEYDEQKALAGMLPGGAGVAPVTGGFGTNAAPAAGVAGSFGVARAPVAPVVAGGAVQPNAGGGAWGNMG